MNIQFTGTEIARLELKQVYRGAIENPSDLSFSYSPAFHESSDQEFLVIFDLSLNSDEGFLLSVQYVARFETDEPIYENFKESNFVKINAPAIAYPFLRTYISNLTLNSGFSPVILPTINFTQM